MSGKYSPKRFDHAKKSAIDALKTSSIRLIQKQQKQIVIWLMIKLLIKSQTFQKKSQLNQSRSVKNEHDKEKPKERYISPEERQQVIDKLRLKIIR